jgi:putative membrane protein
MKELDPAVTTAIVDAVRELELCSCAEVVVEVRGRSGSYAHADARFASLVAFVALLVLLFSPWPFHAPWVAIDVALVWLLGIFSAKRSDAARRLMTSARERETQVRILAASVFHDRGVANTGEETGVLVYLSVMEQRMEVLADRGVLEAVPSMEWNRIVAGASAKAATPATLLEVMRELKPLLERYLPVRAGDVDELCNVPRFVTE